jgi:hypothetical protein
MAGRLHLSLLNDNPSLLNDNSECGRGNRTGLQKEWFTPN